jgi:hypothetical protein
MSKRINSRSVIGTSTTYRGTIPWLRGKVRIVAVMRGDDIYRDATELDRAGGLRSTDRVEVQPWIASGGRYSWVTSDPLASELAIKIA